MANKKTTNSKRFDFLPNKQNKYSIRKFTVGTASILVGATLIFGAHNDAQAEELDKATTEEAAATEEANADAESTATEEATTETPATEEVETPAEQPAEETATEEADTTAEQPAEETATEEADASAEQPAEEIATEEADTTVEQPAAETPTEEADTTVEQPAAETPATAEPVTTTEKPAEVPATDIATVTDQASAADYLVAEKNISAEEANKIASNLNANLSEVTPEALQQAIVDYLANEQNKYNVDGTLAAVREETALTNEDVVNETPVSATAFRSATRAATTDTATRAFDSELQQEAQKGAIYAPGTEGQTQSYAGKAWVYRGGNINNFNEKEPLANAKVYLQWVNGKGFVSPVYYTTTNPDGSYVFDLSKKLIDPTGQEHEFKLAGDGNLAVRTWVENPDPEKYNVIKHGDQKYGFHTRLSRTNESWDFTAGINRIVNGQVLVQEIPRENDWLMKPQDQWTTAPHSDGVWPNEGAYGKISGNVWYETGDPSGSDSRAWKKDSWDVNATGVKVVASYVNDEVTRQFDAWKEANKGYTLEDFRAAQQDIVTKYQAEHGAGSHIAETVVGTVESDGSYYIPFRGLYGVSAQNKGARTSDEEYGQLVADADVNHKSLMQWNGTLGQRHRHINSDYMYVTAMIDDYAIWSNNYQNNMFTTADAGRDIFDAQMLTSANGSKQNFIALAPQPMHDVLVYDSVENYAIPGDTVESKSGGLLPSREYQIQWFKDGVAIGDPVTKVSNVDGTIGSVPITVPADLDKNATYTSAIFHPNEKTTDLSDALAVDSFTAVVDQNIIHEPAYEDTTAKAGEEASVTPTFTTKDGKPVANADVPLATENAFQLDPNATDVPEGVKVDPMTGKITFTPTNDQVGKEITVPVVVTYEDGTTDTVQAKFTVTEATPDADKYDPKATPEEVEKGGKVDLTDNVDLTGLPEGTTVTDVTPADTIDTNTPGDYTGKVEVTYPDGSKDTVDVPVKVKPSQADENTPEVTTEVVDKGGKVDLTDNVDLTKLPDGTTVTDVTPTGTIDTNTPGEYTGKVEVTYPDGSKDTVDVPVVVNPSMADEIDPEVTPEVVEKGGDVDLTDNVVTKLPEGSKVTDVTPDGTIDTNTPGEYPGKVEITYPDGSKETVDVPVIVKETLTDADKNDPKATPEVVEKGGDVDLTDNVDTTDLPEGTTVKDVTPPGTIDTDKPGDYTGLVEVTYPDGSKDTVDVPVTVKEEAKTQADENDPTVTPEVVEKGGDVDLTDNVDLTKLPDGTTVTDVTPTGTIDTNTPGDYTGKVEVTYPDGSKDTVDVPVTVKEEAKTQADENDPTVTPEVVEKGGKVDLTDNVDLTDLPKGTTVTDVTPTGTIDTNTPGDYTGKVEVTYPDGSKDTVDVPVTVKEKLTDADQNDPKVTPEEVDKGGKVDLTDNVDLTDLPEGTTVTDVTPAGTIDTDKPGDYTGKVEVTYPDGSKDTVDVPVKVNPSQADENDPEVTPEVVEKGQDVDLTDNVDLTKLPDGTKVTDVTPTGTIDTNTPGDYTGKVEITYPDGSKETVDVPVTVKEKLTDADQNDPKVTPEEVEKGGDVDLTDNVDLTDLPEGTKVVDVTPEGTIDTDKPGDYTGVVEVVYPDGSKDTVEVPVKVQDTVAPDAPTVTNPQPGDKVITGTAEPNGTVDVTLPNGDVIKDVPVNADGEYTVDVPEGVDLKEGDKVTVVAKDDSGNVSDPTEGTVTDTVAPDAPTVTNPQPGDKVITGTAEPNGTVDVTLPNGDVIKDVPVDAEGNYKVDVPEGVDLKEGDKVTVVAKDDNGNTSTPTEGKVTDTVAPDAPTITNPQPGDKVITGTAEPNGTVDVTLPNGDVIKDVPVDENGNWKVDVPEGVDLKEGDKVTVVAKDGNGNTSTPTEGKVTDTVAPDAPTVNPVKPGDKVVTGKGEPGSTITVKFPDGKEGTATVDKDGNWTVKVPDGTVIKPGDELDVTATDEAGNKSDVTKVKVPDTDKDTVAPDQPTVNPVNPGDKTVTGKGEPGSTITVKFPDGKEGTTTVDKDGNWTVKVPDGTVIKAGDKLIVTATDEAGNTSEPTVVIVKGKDNGMTGMDKGDKANDMGNMDNASNTDKAMKDDMKASKDMNNKGKEMKELPDTGNESTNAPLFGSLIAALGSLFLFGRRRKEKEEK